MKAVPGFYYEDHFIDPDEAQKLIQHIDKGIWSNALKRRVQHYGYAYHYRSRSVNKDMYLGPLPGWVQPLSKRIIENGFMSDWPDQLIVNEYLPGQGIAHHTDCEPCFTGEIVSISLLSCCILELIRGMGMEKVSHVLYPRSLFLIKGTARYHWKHGIPARKTDMINGKRLARTRRVSLTFRKVVLNNAYLK